MARLVALVAVLCAVSTVNAQADFKAGLKNSIDIKVIEQAKDVYFDTVMKLIRNIEIPDIYASNNNDYLIGNHFILQQRSEDVEFYTDVYKNAVVMKCNKLSGQFITDHFRYKELLIVAKGSAEVDINTISIGVGLAFDLQELESGRFVPRVDSVDVNVDIDRFDIRIHLHGNLWTDLGSLFEVFFKGTVVDIINTSVTAVLQQGIPLVANKVIGVTNGYFPVPKIANWMIDWETPERAIVSDSAFSVGVKGLMFDRRVGEVEPSVDIPNMPYLNRAHAEKYQAFISSYTIDSAAGSLLDIAEIEGWAYAADSPDWLPDTTTTTLNVIMSGISDKYGPNRPVDIHYRVLELANFGVEQDNEVLKGTATVDTEFWVELEDGTLEKAADLTLVDTDFAFTALVTDMNVTIHLEQINADKVEVNFSSFGKINALEVKLGLNNFFRAFIPIFNKHLETKQIEVPHNIAGIFELSDLTLGYYDGYIYAGATPTFLPPNGAALFEVGDFEPELPKEIEIEWVMDTTNVEELVFVQ